MGIDWYVKGCARKPTTAEMRTILEDYFNGAAIVEKNPHVRGDRSWLVLLPGKASFPFKRVEQSPARDGGTNQEHRALGIYLEEKDRQVRLSTALADEYTNNVAEGIAKMFARYYKGELEEPS